MDDQLTPAIEPIVYPEDNGRPMSENTRQARWILYLFVTFERLFRARPDVK